MGRIDWPALWRRGQDGWPSRFVLAQFPNAPLLVCLGAGVVARVTSGGTDDVAVAVSRVALAIWAYEEVTRGVNWFRRGLGVAALVVVVSRIA